MKKFLWLTLFVPAMLYAGVNEPRYEVIGSIDPTFVTGTAVIGTSSTIVSAGSGIRNCLTEYDLMSTTIADMKIFNGTLATGTTLWALLQVPANTRVPYDSIIENALCGSTSTQMVVMFHPVQHQ